MLAERTAVSLAPAEGKVIQAMGNTVTIKVGSTETGGAMAVIDYIAGAGFSGPAVHLHRRTDEAFYMIDGTITFQVDDATIDAGPGEFVYIPRGVPHTFSNRSAAPAHFVSVVTPGGFEGYFEELVAVVRESGWPPPAAQMAELGRKYDIVPVGAPQH